MATMNELVEQHLAEMPTQLNQLLQAVYLQDHVVQMDHLLPASLRDEMFTEALLLRENHAVRRDLELEVTGGTPRNYECVGRDAIKAAGQIIPDFFQSPAIRSYLTEICGEKVHCVPYQPEEYIINSQNRPADTHGWHFDDYAFALIWIVEEPGPLNGGRIEYIPHTKWDKETPKHQLEELLSRRAVNSIYIPEGSCYLMRAQTTLHRVTPILNNATRTVIVFSYASTSDLTDKSITHDTVEQIYTEEYFGVTVENA